MSRNARYLFVAALMAATVSASAEPRLAGTPDPARATKVGAEVAKRQQLAIHRAADPKSTAAVAQTAAALPRVNPYKAYPPSCIADPVPDQTSGPTYTTTANLAAYDSVNNQTVLEGVTIRIWRIACSSADSVNAVTLMRIQRQSIYEGDQDVYPLFPVTAIQQGGITYDDPSLRSYARTAVEPNTVISDVLPDTPIVNSTTYILENYANPNSGFFDFNQSFGIRFDNLDQNSPYYFINVPAYNPTVGTYPDAFQNIPVSGYLSTSWYNPATSGEGIVMQVYELLGDTQNFIVNFTWSAYDPSGLPFWLTGQVTVPRGTRTVTTPMAYVTGGGLGGNAGAADPPTIWGSATLSFSDCNHLTLSYASNPGLPSFVPQGSGTRSWLRLGRLNGMDCE